MEIRLQQTYKQIASATFDEQSVQKQQVKTGDEDKERQTGVFYFLRLYLLNPSNILTSFFLSLWHAFA